MEHFQLIASSNRCVLVDIGFTQSVEQMDMTMKPAVIKGLSVHHVFRCKAELDQIREGLDCLKVFESMRAKPELMKKFL